LGVQFEVYVQVPPPQDAVLLGIVAQSPALQHCWQVPLQFRWPAGQHFPELQFPDAQLFPVQQI
jgi:hypothetical protein